MKVLSIKEPFASLICYGIKKIETRSWKTNYRGEIYIHASLAKCKIDNDKKEKINLLLKDKDLNYGMIICKAKLIDCIYIDDDFVNKIKLNENEYLCGDYSIGRYAWVLSDIEVLDEKIPVKGHLGIWNL